MATNAELAARTRYRMKKQDAQDAAARAMLAALQQVYLDSCVRGAMAPGQRDRCAAAIAQAEAAGIRAETIEETEARLDAEAAATFGPGIEPL